LAATIFAWCWRQILGANRAPYWLADHWNLLAALAPCGAGLLKINVLSPGTDRKPKYENL